MKKNLKKFMLCIIAIIAGSTVFQSLTMAQVSFPTRPVTIWVVFPAGGGVDILTRALAEGTEGLGQKIVVINKPGGSGSVGTALLAKEKPDGYTLGASSDSAIIKISHMSELSYDPFLDLSYIIRVGLFRETYVVRADSPFQKWEEVVSWAKKNSGQLVFGHPGIGTAPYIATAMMAQREGFTFKHVPFAGDAPTVSALLGGHVMVACANSVAWRAYVEAKNVRVLLVIEKEGVSYAPDAPTFEKMKYDFEIPTSVVIYGPKGIPDPIREKLEKAFAEGMKSEGFRKVAQSHGLSIDPLTGRDLVEYYKKWNVLCGQYIREIGLYKAEKK